MVEIINFPKISDIRGNLTYLQYPQILPFEVKRVFWTYDFSRYPIRDGHAYKTQHEIIIALSGSFDVIITELDGNKRNYSMNRSSFGIYIPPLTWRHIENISTNALSLHLLDSQYKSVEYFRNHDFTII